MTPELVVETGGSWVVAPEFLASVGVAVLSTVVAVGLDCVTETVPLALLSVAVVVEVLPVAGMAVAALRVLGEGVIVSGVRG